MMSGAPTMGRVSGRLRLAVAGAVVVTALTAATAAAAPPGPMAAPAAGPTRPDPGPATGTPPRGFLLDRGRFTTFTIPGAQATLAYGINDQGQIVGHSISGPTPLTISGFLRDAPGAPHRDQPARRRRHRALRHQQPRPDRGPRRQPLGPDPAQPTDPAPMGRIA
jgi:hypothetical protein